MIFHSIGENCENRGYRDCEKLLRWRERGRFRWGEANLKGTGQTRDLLLGRGRPQFDFSTFFARAGAPEFPGKVHNSSIA